MAYQSNSISAITEIPALLGTFAQSIGWETDLSTPSQPILWRPDAVYLADSNSEYDIHSTIKWKVTAFDDSVNTQRLSVFAFDIEEDSNSDSGSEPGTLTNITSNAQCHAPIIGYPGASLDPSDVYFIGALTPEPYIAIIIRFGANQYRHMYIGNMEKLGTYVGGEVIAATEGPGTFSSFSMTYKEYAQMKYLFESRSGRRSSSTCGGVRVEHEDNDYPWRKFIGTSSSTPIPNIPDDAVIGGFGDSVNDGYLARARSPFAAVNPLVPINLYSVETIIGDKSFRPIGRPAGIRMVNMQDFTPEQEIIVGGYLWRVYPSHRRSSSTTMTRASGSSSGSGYVAEESSHWVGYAYAVAEEDSNSAGA